MHEADVSLKIDDGVHGHASEFEQVDFLFVESGNLFFGVGQANEGNLVLAPIIDER